MFPEKLKRLKQEAELAGLHININKTKGIRVNTSNMQKFRLEEMEIEEVGSFVYLESVVSESEGREEDIASKNQESKWCTCSAVSCVEKCQHIKSI